MHGSTMPSALHPWVQSIAFQVVLSKEEKLCVSAVQFHKHQESNLIKPSEQRGNGQLILSCPHVSHFCIF